MTSFTRSDDRTGHLKLLGAGRMVRPEGGPGAHLLETFPNRFPHRPYIISLAFPEYTSLCPVTGQPDFGVIVAEYIPGDLCVESKSFKLYMFAYREHQSFMETVANTVLEDLVRALDPLWCRVKGLFSPRGGTHIHVFAEHFAPLEDMGRRREIRRAVSEWKREAAPHGWGR